MKSLYTLILFFVIINTKAQQQTYGLFTFTPPKAWTKTVKQNGIEYSVSDKTKHTWARIGILKSTMSKGSIEKDFGSEWSKFVVKPYKQFGVTDRPIGIDSQIFHGWKMITGLGKFLLNKDSVALLLNTFSDGHRCTSFILLSNTASYGKTLDEFIASINLAEAHALGRNKTEMHPASSAMISGFVFNAINFNDGSEDTLLSEKLPTRPQTKKSTR